jgi:hypothetical protein
MIRLYNLQVKQREKQNQTNILGTRMLLTLGVEILGKQPASDIFTPFLSIKELIDCKKTNKKRT